MTLFDKQLAKIVPSETVSKAFTTGRDLVVVGASAGGIDAIRSLLTTLSADFPAAILIVLHVGERSPAMLAKMFSKAGVLPAKYAGDGDPVVLGEVRIAPSGTHLIVEPGVMRLVRGPKENHSRPAIDPLFRSAAWAYGPRVIGVLLSGMLNDGSAGLWDIKTCGGLAVVQDPNDAGYGDMPRNALEHLPVDHCVPIDEMGALLARLVREPVSPETTFPVPEQIKIEARMAQMKDNDIALMHQIGKLSPFTCPSCSGALWEINDTNVLRFRCHTGHAYTAESLSDDQADSTENALYAAVRALEEKGRLAQAIADRSRDQRPALAESFDQTARESVRNAEQIRGLLQRHAG